jgi:transglutaminase-like putative cysteine protease
MTLAREEPASVISCVARAREGARTVRDVVSAEMWEAVNTTDLALSAGDVAGQDFVHLALVLLRRNGIAARYVSGYLFSAPRDGGTAPVEVQTHAWIEALLPGTGGRGEPIWVGADPTNRVLAGETHVKIGHGRRYGDVPPIKGVYRGAGGAELDASVHMTRLDPAASART